MHRRKRPSVRRDGSPRRNDRDRQVTGGRAGFAVGAGGNRTVRLREFVRQGVPWPRVHPRRRNRQSEGREQGVLSWQCTEPETWESAKSGVSTLPKLSKTT